MARNESLWHVQLRQAPQRSHFILQDETTSAKPEGCWDSSTRKVLMAAAAAAAYRLEGALLWWIV